MTHELVVKGRAYINGTLRYAEIGIDDGKISCIGPSVKGDEVLDIGSSGMILPGFIDPHVHMRDPGMTQKEDFSTGTMSAVCGGVTCVFDMPNTKPPVTDLDTLTDKKAILKGRAYCDYGVFAALTPNSHIGILAPHVCGFKLFMGSTTGNILMNDDAEIFQLMDEIGITGKVLSVHAEDNDMISTEEEKCTRDHLRNRPAKAEHNAIRRLGSHRTCKVNICHCSTAESLDLASSFGFTSEVTLHHMVFDVDRNTDAFYKTNPPIRDASSRDALWQAFLKGKATMFGTDHAPHTHDEKSTDFGSAPGGIPGVETTMPIFMDMIRKETVPLDMVVAMGSRNPADTFSLNKGRIDVGYDADLSVFDLRHSTKIDVKKLHSKAGHSPYAGMDAVFPDTVICAGNIQLADGEFCGSPTGVDINGI